MDQKKIGAFLRQLRKEQALTQEQLAEQFRVTGRSVSRWENGNNLPDLSILIELADYYDVEIREILDGERKGQAVERETKENLAAVAEYSGEEKSELLHKMHMLFLVGFAGLCCAFSIPAFGLGNTAPYQEIANFGLGLALGMSAAGVISTSRYGAKIRSAKRRLLKIRKGSD